MKKFSKVLILSLLTSLFITSCEKDMNTEPSSSLTDSQSKQSDPKKSDHMNRIQKNNFSDDSLAISFINLGNYYIQQNDIHNGDFFDYVINNPNTSLSSLEDLGYIDADIAIENYSVIQNETMAKSDEEITDIINYVATGYAFTATMDLDTDTGTLEIDGSGGDRIIIFQWRGLLSKQKNCLTTFFGQWGGGC